MKQRKVVVFAPHPDDETLGCGGTIAKRINEGHDVSIVVMTDGRNALTKVLGIDSNPTPEELKEIRRNELEAAARILGVPEKNLFLLDCEDGTLENHEREAECRIAAILRKNLPVEVYYTYEKDHNPDHRAANRIVRNTIRTLHLSTARYQYSITQTFSRIGPLMDFFLNFFKRNMIYVDISEFIDLKKAALEEYRSEIGMISSKQKRPVLSSRTVEMHLKDKELFFKDG